MSKMDKFYDVYSGDRRYALAEWVEVMSIRAFREEGASLLVGE